MSLAFYAQPHWHITWGWQRRYLWTLATLPLIGLRHLVRVIPLSPNTRESMSQRELLHRALEALEYGFEGELYRNLVRDILAELEKPEPVTCGYVGVTNGALLGFRFNLSENGNYKLLAVRIDDDN